MNASSVAPRIYLNNAATSYPKPDVVIDTVARTLSNELVEPGRNSGPADIVSECRKTLAAFFEAPSPLSISFQPSATYALNTVIVGLLIDGGHAISTVSAHNSMIRPLNHMVAERGASVDYLPTDAEGRIDADDLRKKLRKETAIIAMTHASNVTGAVQPLEAVAAVAAEAEVPLLIDAAQSAGAIPISYNALPGRVFVAFAGHKGLFGPAGIGGLILPDDTLKQTVYGGTGIRSESPLHPEMLPLRHEAGTPNIPGIAGLNAGVGYITARGLETLAAHRKTLVRQLRASLESNDAVMLSPYSKTDDAIGIVSFRVRNLEPGAVGFMLDEVFGISVRTGLHCAPLIHAHMDTVPHGTIRVSVGPFNTQDDIARFSAAMEEICKR